jgi:hypothetical protein
LDSHQGVAKCKLSYVIVGDVPNEGAFDEAVVSDPPFDAIVHTTSPFHFNVTDSKKDLLDPAILGTTGILKAIKARASNVKRVVITSSLHQSSIRKPSQNSILKRTGTLSRWKPLKIHRRPTGQAKRLPRRRLGTF